MSNDKLKIEEILVILTSNMSDKSIVHTLENKDVVLGGCGTNILCDYNKNVLLSEKLSATKFTVLDDDGEYKLLCDALGIEYIIEKLSN